MKVAAGIEPAAAVLLLALGQPLATEGSLGVSAATDGAESEGRLCAAAEPVDRSALATNKRSVGT